MPTKRQDDVAAAVFGIFAIVLFFLLVACVVNLGIETENGASYRGGVQTQSQYNLDVAGCEDFVTHSNPASPGFWLAGCYDSIGR